ncbi:Uncharacterised protein [Metamycoplasma cloacale]|uniref:Uncharacterized protein n=1 Tax=Metamycoplasma cloacale TaxID=92401 RepID=A0A2Z4LLM2_9BACT|nr:hypothetical protein [Metamycoplasma cloacale]AWX42564.1 hypothetical protein DK849_00485 [Metamycoplasma cloacale]VEU79740.1 Uncharacterised protein [Metamycoplasma cloacale]
METKTMTDIAIEIIGSSKGKEFSDIFEGTKNVLLDQWIAESKSDISEEELLEVKRGILYKLLTIDGNFFRNEDGTWTTIRPDRE